MKCIAAIVETGGWMWLAGCASVPSVTVREPVGPAPTNQAKATGQGYLQVYSARLREDVRPEGSAPRDAMLSASTAASSRSPGNCRRPTRRPPQVGAFSLVSGPPRG